MAQILSLAVYPLFFLCISIDTIPINIYLFQNGGLDGENMSDLVFTIE